ARLLPAFGDREVDARIIEHPFRIVMLHDGGLRGKERRIKTDRTGKIVDSDMDMHTLHVPSFRLIFSQAEIFALFSRAGLQATGAQASASPPQQFSVR